MKLEKQAAAAGGAVHALIGNHEAMNVYGDLRYVSPGEFASYAHDPGAEAYVLVCPARRADDLGQTGAGRRGGGPAETRRGLPSIGRRSRRREPTGAGFAGTIRR